MTIVLTIEYDGTSYAGWQIQPNAETVQAKLNEAIKNIIHKDVTTIAAGRTDAGVHSAGQIVHFECDEFNIQEDKIVFAINTLLPNDIRIIAAKIVNHKFHARFDAVAREYIYRLSTEKSVFNRYYSWQVPYKLDVDLLEKSASIFIGKYDFTTFSKLNKGVANYVCDVEVCVWRIINSNNFELTIKADRFVYGMVRALVGVMLEVARGKRDLEEVKLALKKCDRRYISPLAAACGLTLNKIYY